MRSLVVSEASELTVRELESFREPRKVAIFDHRLVRRQKTYAALTAAIPTIATAYALVLAVQDGVSLLNVSLGLSFYLITLVGITVGFHRLLAHHAFKAARWIKIVLAVFATWSAQGPVLHWVSNHRRHHMLSDQNGDPHSPNLFGPGTRGGLRGLFHAHIGSMFADEVTNYVRFAPDLLRDRDLRWINQHYWPLVASGLAFPTAIGGLATLSFEGAWTALLWGGFVRMFAVHHAIWSITSIAHSFGAKMYRSDDESRNSYLLALLTGGEGWHNTHHAFPKAAIFTMSCWHVDIGGIVIWSLEKLGLAHDVHRVTVDARKAKSLM
jgi:stearoyl-CoA desaturase (Delta-9 desaturase)